MSIIAVDKNGIKYNSFEVLDSQIKNVEFFCPNCDDKLIFVNSVVKIKHFRHYHQNNCSNEPDTESHILFKRQINDILVSKGYKCDYEVKIGNRVADIFAMKENINLIVECQISPISPEELSERDFDYRQFLTNCETIWIFHLNKNYARFLRYSHTIKNNHEFAIFNLSRVEREFNGDSRIRYFDGENILKIQFKPRKRWKYKYSEVSSFYLRTPVEDSYKTQGILWTSHMKEEIEKIKELQKKEKSTNDAESNS